MNLILKILKSKKFILTVVLLTLIFVWFNWPSEITEYNYGVTFSAKYARELGLDPEETFDAIINDLGINKVRLVAYWDEIEHEKDVYDFSDLDWQMKKAEENNLSVILAVGRRVPRWPECHFPEWIYGKSWEKQQDELVDYLRVIVNRYKDSKALSFWQIENEPFLTAYVPEICGSELDRTFLDEEISIVRRLDPAHRIIATDSGNLGTWLGAYKRGHIFGSTFYIYLANPRFGEVKSLMNHNYYKLKRSIAILFHGYKPALLIEVSLEPWLNAAMAETPIEEQLRAMSIERIDEIIEISAKTNFDDQYLWGAEWWYYLKKKDHPEIWDHLKEGIFSKKNVSEISF
jgi:hypothetical protein